MQKLDPVQGILAIIDDASFTGTNKLSLLLVILDLAPMVSKESRLMSLDDIVEKTLELHWNHSDVFAFTDGTRQVKQLGVLNRNNIEPVIQVERVKSTLESSFKYEIARARADQNVWQEARRKIRSGLLKNPIKKLQNLPGEHEPFLYEMSADKKHLQFFPGVIEDLVRWGGVLRPVIELHYLNFVLKANKTESHQDDLYTFLFGEDRSMPPLTVRPRLWELQNKKCIYSGEPLAKPIKTKQQQLDHVLPWSRIRMSVIENFVLTDGETNGEKSALLLSADMLEKWLTFMDSKHDKLVEIAQEHAWPSDRNRVIQGLKALYSTEVPPVVWEPKHVFQMSAQEQKRAIQLLEAS